MATPAQRHAMRVSAIRASQRDNAPLRHASPYEQMLVKLAADRRTLSAIRSKERKADKNANYSRCTCRGSLAYWKAAPAHRMTF